MSKEIKTQSSLFLIIPVFIGLLLILFAIYVGFYSKTILEQVLSLSLLIPGMFIVIYSFREFKYRQKGKLIIKHDERSEINRLKAADWAFRFLFTTLALLILLNSVKLINEIIFVAITGPLIAAGVIIYYACFYWFERKD